MKAAGKPAIIYSSRFLEHDTGDHPERAARLRRVLGDLDDAGTLAQFDLLTPAPVEQEWLTRVHDPAYVRFLEDFCAAGGGLLAMDPTPASRLSYNAALYAAGAGTLAVDELLSASPRPSFALVRPPGHHALADRAMGFCLFNNIAVAANYAVERHHARRVLIIDYDVHHGNGTQDIFYHDGRVLFFSIHEHPLYPGSGFADESGAGDGELATINVPLPAGTGDRGYAKAFSEVLLPAARRFRPDLLLVSAGFDGHWRDPLASMNVSLEGFAHLAQVIFALSREVCDGRVAFFLEGGYDLEVLSAAVGATCAAILGRPFFDPIGPAAGQSEPNIDRVLAAVKAIHNL